MDVRLSGTTADYLGSWLRRQRIGPIDTTAPENTGGRGTVSGRKGRGTFLEIRGLDISDALDLGRELAYFCYNRGLPEADKARADKGAVALRRDLVKLRADLEVAGAPVGDPSSYAAFPPGELAPVDPTRAGDSP
jgi:hypothetical protein